MHPYRRLLNRAFRNLSGGSLILVLWDGSSTRFGEGLPHVRLKLNRAGIVPGLLLDPEMTVGEAVTRGDLEIEGRMEEFLTLLGLSDPEPSWTQRLAGIPAGLRAALRSSGAAFRRHRRDVSHHYDLGNAFYRLWLDPTMSYSCAYFRNADDSLEAAQRAKIRHTLDKLRLQPGETLLDVGCGWGALVREAAERHGADALGITLSHEQAAAFPESPPPARGRAKVELKHYHALADEGRAFDKIVSVGMAEHVGRRQLPGFHQDLRRLLKPGGLLLHHCITYQEEAPTNPWLLRRIFPGGYIPSFREVVHSLTRQGFVVWDVENLGPHYALTLDHWLEAFERHADTVETMYGADFVRMWRFYLQISAASFRVEDVYVHQILASRGRPARLPYTRDDLQTFDAPSGPAFAHGTGAPPQPNP